LTEQSGEGDAEGGFGVYSGGVGGQSEANGGRGSKVRTNRFREGIGHRVVSLYIEYT